MGVLFNKLKKMSITLVTQDWKNSRMLLVTDAIPASNSASLMRQNGSRYVL